jgi:hypothetical protein
LNSKDMNFGTWNRFLKNGKPFRLTGLISFRYWAGAGYSWAEARAQLAGWILAHVLAARPTPAHTGLAPAARAETE